MTQRSIVSLVLLAIVATSASALKGESPVPPTRPAVDAGATAAIQRLIDSKRLRLGTDAPSAATKFWFKFHLTLPAAAKSQPFDVVVARDEGKIGILVVAADGLPFAYMTDGLFVRVDATTPGGLLAHEGGSASFIYGMDDQGPAGHFNYGSKGGKSRISVDPGQILESLLKKMVQAEHDATKRITAAVTERGAQVAIEASSDKPETYPLKTLLIGVGDKSRVGFGAVQLNAAPPPLLARSLKDFRDLNLPVRMVEDKELDHLAALPPVDFAKDPKERAAAERLKSLFSKP